MSTGSTSWLDRVVGGCIGLLIGVGALYCAVRLLESMLPALIVIGGVLGLIAATMGLNVVFSTWRDRW